MLLHYSTKNGRVNACILKASDPYWKKGGGENITIKQIREEVLQMTQEQVAKVLGIKRSSYWQKEAGRRSFKAEEVLTICKLAHVNPLEVSL